LTIPIVIGQRRYGPLLCFAIETCIFACDAGEKSGLSGMLLTIWAMASPG
jgi:hypothetical protein